ncbi:hypothetical protein GCM10009804_52260 [Kribbella hippodromi]|uniref:Uncharacterized protein n=1 Tax=Kribbella hippodromi TaxID=434347 RepID=A0ABP4PS30_9ACTN
MGWTAIDCEHWAMSLPLGAAWRAYAPEWGAVVVTPPAGQFHPDKVPDSKPAFVTRLVAAVAELGTRKAMNTASRLMRTAAWGRCAGGFMPYKL